MTIRVEHIKLDIELQEHLRVHRAVWRLQEMFVVAVVLLMLLTLGGLFGNGGFSHSTATKGGAVVQYERFARYGKETVLEVSGAQNSVRVPASYFRHFKLTAVVPEADSQQLRDGEIVFRFDSPQPVDARFHLLPQTVGTVRVTIQTGNGAFDISQFVYP